MATTTLGVKMNSETQNRLKMAAENLDRTPHWFMKVAILELIKKVESGVRIEDIIDEKLLPDDTDRNSVAMRNLRERSDLFT
jgi:predicted transcriptional regulator